MECVQTSGQNGARQSQSAGTPKPLKSAKSKIKLGFQIELSDDDSDVEEQEVVDVRQENNRDSVSALDNEDSLFIPESLESQRHDNDLQESASVKEDSPIEADPSKAEHSTEQDQTIDAANALKDLTATSKQTKRITSNIPPQTSVDTPTHPQLTNLTESHRNLEPARSGSISGASTTSKTTKKPPRTAAQKTHRRLQADAIARTKEEARIEAAYAGVVVSQEAKAEMMAEWEEKRKVCTIMIQLVYKS